MKTPLQDGEDRDVVLVSMPFGSPFRPSLGLSLLKASLDPGAVSSEILYFVFPFADRIGHALYTQISNGYPMPHDLVGDWLFAAALFDLAPDSVERFVQDVLRGGSPAHAGQPEAPKRVSDEFVASLVQARQQVPAFLDDCLAAIVARRPAIVGFTSMFQQHVASLALAKRIKDQPGLDTFIVFGGPNCEGDMGAELVRRFDFVDAVVSGEADTIFAELVQRVRAGQDIEDMPGVRTRRNVEFALIHEASQQVSDMDALPFPDFDDFFQQAHASYSPHLLFESSRGCWWGEKHQCTFCGLNGLTMNYRSKSATRAVAELQYLTDRYKTELVFAVDNILNMRYFNGFFEELTRRDIRLDLVYEVKANLKKDQLRQLRSAGVRQIQPGIESLSDAVLACMRKGVKGLQNVQLLKWCQELGIAPFWNILWGFPDEPAEEYGRMAALVPLLAHLPPPADAGPIRLDRFSPNFDEAEERGLIDVQPYPAYRHVFALPDESLARLAYYFTYRYRDSRDPSAYTRDFRQAVQDWRSAYLSSYLFFADEGNRLLVWDFRPMARKPLTLLLGFARELYLECDGVRAASQLPAGAEQELQPLVEQGLVLRDHGAYLSLAIPVGDYAPPPAARDRMDDVLRQATARIAAW